MLRELSLSLTPAFAWVTAEKYVHVRASVRKKRLRCMPLRPAIALLLVYKVNKSWEQRLISVINISNAEGAKVRDFRNAKWQPLALIT